MNLVKCFLIGDYCFELQYPEILQIPTHFLQFETETGTPEHTYRIYITADIPLPDTKTVIKRADLAIQQTTSGENRYIGIKGIEGYYACYRDVSEHYSEILFNMQKVSGIYSDPIFMSLLAMERIMIRKESLILHCAYIEHGGAAILFSAPSETGKTTQAGLWEQYRGSRTINGDRALLRLIHDQWYADGWPVCGSSNICSIELLPVHTIVMLRQGKENNIIRLSPMQAFSQLYSQITINQWNRDYVQKAISLIEQLVTAVPVYQLTCDISEDAVICLEKAIETL